MKLKYFKTAASFRQWLEANHASATELWLGFYKKDSGKVGITYAEALDEALCFGWIDGLKKRVDKFSFTHRFTPRKPNSNWSLLNIRHVERLKKAGLMRAAGLKAFAARLPSSCQFLGNECEAGANPRTPAGSADERFEPWSAAGSIGRREIDRSPPPAPPP